MHYYTHCVSKSRNKRNFFFVLLVVHMLCRCICYADAYVMPVHMLYRCICYADAYVMPMHKFAYRIPTNIL